jgi:hypothetical protein
VTTEPGSPNRQSTTRRLDSIIEPGSTDPRMRSLFS